MPGCMFTYSHLIHGIQYAGTPCEQCRVYCVLCIIIYEYFKTIFPVQYRRYSCRHRRLFYTHITVHTMHCSLHSRLTPLKCFTWYHNYKLLSLHIFTFKASILFLHLKRLNNICLSLIYPSMHQERIQLDCKSNICIFLHSSR